MEQSLILLEGIVQEVGFEPTKRDATDLKSVPFDQAREPLLAITRDTFSPELLKVTTLVPAVGLEPTTTRLKVLRSTD